MFNLTRYQSVALASLGGLVALSWAVLAWLETSPWGVIFHAHGIGHQAHAVAWSEPTAAVLFVLGWTIMVIAMMLPSTFPLIEIFRRLVQQSPRAPALSGTLVTGYLVVWTACGVLVYGAQLGLRTLGIGIPQWSWSASLFLLAGLFQFSALKYRCLDRCRSPLSFVLTRWRGEAGMTRAFRIGLDHGIFCIGCCWALMLLMFAAGTAHLLWMLILGLLMGIEKNMAWGRGLGRPLGYILIATAGLITTFNIQLSANLL